MLKNSRSLRIEWGDCDPAGIVFYPRFFAWMDLASHVLAREMGIPREAMLPPGGDCGFPIVGATAQFLSSAKMDDQLEVRTFELVEEELSPTEDEIIREASNSVAFTVFAPAP